jgi:hypothetical protein
LPEDNHVPLSQESRYSGLDSSVDPLWSKQKYREEQNCLKGLRHRVVW